MSNHGSAAFLRKKVVIIAIAGMMMIPAHARAQSGQSMKSRLDRLERDIQTLSRAVYRGEAPPRPKPQERGGENARNDFRANMQVQLSDLEERLRTLTGKYERAGNRLDKLEKRLETALSDIEMRLKKLENADRSAQSSSGQPAREAQVAQNGRETQKTGAHELAQSIAEGEQTDQSPDGATLGTIPEKNHGQSADSDNADRRGSNGSEKPAQAYEQAFAKLQDGEYEAAAKAFQAFKANYPDHKLIQNAQYWLGETYYARDQYKKAAQTFANGYQNHPQGNKAADNLLKLGLSLEAMDRNQDACVALNRLQEKFGDSAGAVIRRAEKESKRIGCE